MPIFNKLGGGWAAFCFWILAVSTAVAEEPAAGRRHLVFWAGTPQQVEAFIIEGRQPGPTVMIMGGIQGDEPGGFLSADLYADLGVKRGRLIVVPRAGFKAITRFHRGPDGDLNRKFGDSPSQAGGDSASVPATAVQPQEGRGGARPPRGPDPDQRIIAVLKELMAQSDLLLNLHDGSGFYRPTRESDLANPGRYGQCIIADAEVYTHPASGRVIRLGERAREVIQRVNREIDDPRHRFYFFDTKTGAEKSRHSEQRGSATYYALTRLGIPAFGVEASKQLPSLEMKVRHHNLAVNAFLELAGVELEQPALGLETPKLGYAVVLVDRAWPLAVADGQTLKVARGQTIEAVHVAANYDRGLSADVLGLGDFNDLGRPLAIRRPTAVVIRKDHYQIGRFQVDILPAKAGRTPRLTGPGKPQPPRAATPVDLDDPAQARAFFVKTAGLTPAAPPVDAASPLTGRVTGFRLEVDGRPVTVEAGRATRISAGSLVKLVGLAGEGSLPDLARLNLRGYVPETKRDHNDGDDRGFTVDTGRDLGPASATDHFGRIYYLNAGHGRRVEASAALRLVPPQLIAVVLEAGGRTHHLPPGGRLDLPPGTPVTITAVETPDERPLPNLLLTRDGQPWATNLPQILTVPAGQIELTIGNGAVPAARITLAGQTKEDEHVR